MVMLAAGLRFWGLARQGMWYDESVTAWLLRGSPGQLLQALPHTESTPPLYYLVAWGWTHVLGDTTVGLRSLSALAGVATVPCTFAAARTLVNRRVAVFAALLVAVNPLLVWYSQESRAYALFVLTTSLSLWAMGRARADPTRGRLLTWALAASAMLCTHYFGLFVALPEALVLLADRRGRLRWRLLAVSAVGAAGVSLLVLAEAQRHRHYWFLGLPLRVRMIDVARHFLVGFTPPAGIVPAAVAATGALLALLVLVVRGVRIERRGAILAGTVAAGAVAAPFALALAGADYVNSRNMIGALVPAAIVVAAGFGAREARRFGVVAAAVLAGVSIWMIAALPTDGLAQRPPWQKVAAVLRTPPGIRAILLEGSTTWGRPLSFYLPRTWWLGPRGALVSQIDVLRRVPTRHDCPGTSWWGATCDVGPRPPLRRAPAPGFHLVGTQRVGVFAIARYDARHAIRIYPHHPFERRGRPGARAGRPHVLLTDRRSPPLP
jgi:mannosyltransferase